MVLSELIKVIPNSIIKKERLETISRKENYIMNNLDLYAIDSLTLYHGSYAEQLKPMYGKGKPYNDYGLGFYTTLDIEMAKEWAHTDSLKSGFVYEIELDVRDLTVFNYNTEPIYVWIAELFKNRRDYFIDKRLVDIDTFIELYHKEVTSDLVFGWRADASFYGIADLFLNGTIPYEEIYDYFHLGNQGNQIMLKSSKAFERIISVKNLGTVPYKYYEHYTTRAGLAVQQVYNETKFLTSSSKRTTFDHMVRYPYE